MQINGVKNTMSMTLSPTAVQSIPEKPKLASPAPTSPPSKVCDVELGNAVNMLIADQISAASIVENNINPLLTIYRQKTIRR